MKYLEKIGSNSKKAFQKLKYVNHNKIKKVLDHYNSAILKNKKKLINENIKDVKSIKRKHLIDRLILNDKRIEGIRHSINEIAKFKNPIGRIIEKWKRPNGLKIHKVTTPIGVIGVIFESRPNVACDISALCFKSGNNVILRGGSESFHSNKILINLFRHSLKKIGFDPNIVQLIEKQNRKLVDFFLSRMENYIDVIIPRGGKNLFKKVKKISSVPTIGHLEGICHIYVDKGAELNMAIKIVNNAKLRRTSNCGAVETLLIDKSKIDKFCYPILNELSKNKCKIIGDKIIRQKFKNTFRIAEEKDWSTEYLAPIISVKCVNGVDEAIKHINKYGTMHTDSIITNNKKVAEKFLNNIKSSIALHNTSTQFADGGEFGFGGEVGISTSTLPPRGPVGLEQLVSYKYEISSKGKTRK